MYVRVLYIHIIYDVCGGVCSVCDSSGDTPNSSHNIVARYLIAYPVRLTQSAVRNGSFESWKSIHRRNRLWLEDCARGGPQDAL